MNLRKSQLGFSAVELVIVLVVLGLLGFVGYTVYNQQQNKTATNDSGQVTDESPTAKDVGSAPEITTTDDLNKAEIMLDQTDPDTSNADASQLDSQAAAF